MTKLERVRQLLQKALMSFEHISTDKAILEYDGEELEVGTPVHGVNEEGETFELEDGEYRTEENIVYVIADGTVVEIRDENEQAEPEAPAETEAPAAEENEEEEPAAEPEADPRDERIANLEAEVARLEEELGAARERIAELEKENDELKNKPAAEPAEEQFERATRVDKTGNAKIDRLLKRFSKE